MHTKEQFRDSKRSNSSCFLPCRQQNLSEYAAEIPIEFCFFMFLLHANNMRMFIFQETFAMRDTEKHEKKEQMVSSLLDDFKYLEYGEYMLEELQLILQKTPNEMVHLSREATFVMDALVKLTPSKRLKNEVSTKLNEQFPCIKIIAMLTVHPDFS